MTVPKNTLVSLNKDQPMVTFLVTANLNKENPFIIVGLPGAVNVAPEIVNYVEGEDFNILLKHLIGDKTADAKYLDYLISSKKAEKNE